MADSSSGARADSGRRTPLYDTRAALGARFVPFAGWDMPVRYGSILDEARAVRSGAGLFDVSHMGRLKLDGADVADAGRTPTAKSRAPKDGWARLFAGRDDPNARDRRRNGAIRSGGRRRSGRRARRRRARRTHRA